MRRQCDPARSRRGCGRPALQPAYFRSAEDGKLGLAGRDVIGVNIAR